MQNCFLNLEEVRLVQSDGIENHVIWWLNHFVILWRYKRIPVVFYLWHVVGCCLAKHNNYFSPTCMSKSQEGFAPMCWSDELRPAVRFYWWVVKFWWGGQSGVEQSKIQHTLDFMCILNIKKNTNRKYVPYNLNDI